MGQSVFQEALCAKFDLPRELPVHLQDLLDRHLQKQHMVRWRACRAWVGRAATWWDGCAGVA